MCAQAFVCLGLNRKTQGQQDVEGLWLPHTSMSQPVLRLYSVLLPVRCAITSPSVSVVREAYFIRLLHWALAGLNRIDFVLQRLIKRLTGGLPKPTFVSCQKRYEYLYKIKHCSSSFTTLIAGFVFASMSGTRGGLRRSNRAPRKVDESEFAVGDKVEVSMKQFQALHELKWCAIFPLTRGYLSIGSTEQRGESGRHLDSKLDGGYCVFQSTMDGPL